MSHPVALCRGRSFAPGIEQNGQGHGDRDGQDDAEAAEQAADTIANLKLAFGIIPAVILAVAVIAAIAYSLTKENYALLLTAAETKENGAEYRVEGLEKVL